MKTMFAKRILAVIACTVPLTVLPSNALSAQVCKPPSSAVRAKVLLYVQRRDHLTSLSQITETESAVANAACFWKFQLKETGSSRPVTVFLSPDAAYLTSTLADINSDPLEEERSRQAQLGKALLAGGPPSQGASDSKVTIVEFSDFECPYCRRLTDVLEKEVLPAQGKNVQLVFRNFPLSMHPWAKSAAQMAQCAAMQKSEAFWSLHNFFFQNQQQLNAANLTQQVSTFIAAHPSIDEKQFTQCMDRDIAVGPVEQDVSMGVTNGVHATPTLFINGVRYDGYKDAAQLTAIISQAMTGQAQTDSQPTQPGTVASRNTQCIPTSKSGGRNVQQ